MKTSKLKTTAIFTMLLSGAAINLPIAKFSQDGIIWHDTDIKEYIDLGNTPEFNCVGRYSESVESRDYACGVLISPNWVLTASHFVKDTSFWKFGNKFYQTKQIGSPTPLKLEIGGSKGDSGGGIFMENNGEMVLVGIVSGALNREIKYGAVLALARVSTANEWIDSVVSE